MSTKTHITFIANWKMYSPFDTTITQIANNLDMLASIAKNKQISLFLAPTLPAIKELATIFKNTNILWCAQNCSEHIAGAYTGQISAETLKSIGCNACIIGHSECRKYNSETNISIASKLQMLLDYELSPIICIGEQEKDFKNKQTIAVLQEQLQPLFTVLTTNQHKINELKVYLAYEPIWSIGTNIIADHAHLETIFTWLCQQIKRLFPAINLHLLYGGSVNTKTIGFLKKITQIQGYLIGTASLDLQEFEKIVKCIMVE